MPKPPELAFDNLDDRREMQYLLEKLSPSRRILFLQWACTQCRGGLKPRPSRATKGDAIEVFFDLWSLAFQYELDLDQITRELERFVSRPSSSACRLSAEQLRTLYSAPHIRQ